MTQPLPDYNLRSGPEIQRAHDVLWAIVMGEVPTPLQGSTNLRQSLQVALDVLCWSLHHDHNTAFADLLAALMERLGQMGYGLVDSGRLSTDPRRASQED